MQSLIFYQKILKKCLKNELLLSFNWLLIELYEPLKCYLKKLNLQELTEKDTMRILWASLVLLWFSVINLFKHCNQAVLQITDKQRVRLFIYLFIFFFEKLFLHYFVFFERKQLRQVGHGNKFRFFISWNCSGAWSAYIFLSNQDLLKLLFKLYICYLGAWQLNWFLILKL